MKARLYERLYELCPKRGRGEMICGLPKGHTCDHAWIPDYALPPAPEKAKR